MKTTASDRLIPVHPSLIDCGLLHFAEAKRKAGEKKLFDDIETGSTGSRPVAFSKWFTQFLRACSAHRSRTSFHSFRHNFRDELRAARIDHYIAMLLGGWTTGSARAAVHENYGSGYRVDALNEAVRRLSFKDVDHRARYTSRLIQFRQEHGSPIFRYCLELAAEIIGKMSECLVGQI